MSLEQRHQQESILGSMNGLSGKLARSEDNVARLTAELQRARADLVSVFELIGVFIVQDHVNGELTDSLEKIAKLSRELTEHSGATQTLKRCVCLSTNAAYVTQAPSTARRSPQ